jgi:hypothetical protein
MPFAATSLFWYNSTKVKLPQYVPFQPDGDDYTVYPFGLQVGVVGGWGVG